MNLMVIDGNSIVNRAFYGVRMLNAKDGTPTNAVFGFLNILQKLLSESAPDALCVTFDLKAPTFRHKQYEGYKAQRKAMPEELAVQMPILKEVLDAMNIPRYELEGWEADDLIGTIAAKCAAAGWQCTAVTGDKDSFQLISGTTVVKHVKTRMGQTETIVYDRDRFVEEYGFEPINMIDLKALMGDASDNIPGVAGVGEKTALDLIRRFKDVEDIYSDLEGLDVKEAVRKKLDAGREMAEMSYSLAKIHCDAPIEFSPEGNRVTQYDNDRLYEIFKRLGFLKFIEKFGLVPTSGVKQAEQVSQWQPEKITVDTYQQAEKMLEDMKNTGITDIYAGEALEAMCAVCGDRLYTVTADTENYDDVLRKIFTGDFKKSSYEIKELHRKLLRRGIEAKNWQFDTALAAYLLSPTDSAYPLEKLTDTYLNREIISGDENSGQMSLLSSDTETKHLEECAEAVALLRPVLEKKLEETGLLKLLEEIELPLCPVLAEMERAGFLVDKTALTDFSKMLSQGIEVAENEIYALAGEKFNVNSPKQLGAVLFDKLMLPAPKKTKTGYSTGADVLEKLSGKHPIIEYVLNFRQLSKLKSTYADGLTAVIAEDGRIHTSFQMTVTATGRLSSTEPNLQNIPVRTELGGEIRKMFIAPEGMMLVDADYSQIELRLLAHISGDEVMQKAFLDGEDIHAATAAQVMGIPIEQVTKLQRSHAKAVNFGIVYGISAFSLAQDIKVSVAEAKGYMESYFEKYSGVRRYMKDIIEKAKSDGYVETLYGRRRYLPELKSSNFNLRSFGERVALNMPIQGTAADIMKIAMIRVNNALKESGLKARLILQIHDELIAECPEEETAQVAALLAKEMEGAAQLSVPLTAEAKWGKSWFEAK